MHIPFFLICAAAAALVGGDAVGGGNDRANASQNTASAAPGLYPGSPPGKAGASADGSRYMLSNGLFKAEFSASGGSVHFEGLKASDGTVLVEGGSPLFVLRLQDGRILNSDNLSAGKVKLGNLKAIPNSPQAALRAPGKTLTALFTAPDNSFSVRWRAVLRDGSHYLRQEFKISADKEVQVDSIQALEYRFAPAAGQPVLSGNTTHGRVAVSEKLFAGLETPMSVITIGGENTTADSWSPRRWTPDSFKPVFSMPASFRRVYGDRFAAKDGPVLQRIAMSAGSVCFTRGGECRITFQIGGDKRQLHVVGVQLLDAEGRTLDEDVHSGYSGSASSDNVYVLKVPGKGEYQLRYWAEARTGSVDSRGDIELSLPLAQVKRNVSGDSGDGRVVRGCWNRKTALPAGQSWEVSGVVGLIAPRQARRSFLAYSERERAVAYRPFVHYNDWYEIGIRLHDNQNPSQRTNEKMWLDLLAVWQRELFEKRRTRVDAFVVDDGWDDFNSLWDFHIGFPKGFSRISKAANQQKAGIGAWLGPVGGYGASKKMRLDYWNRKHPKNRIDNFHLSNQEYFNAFVNRCRMMIRDYDMRYFKFDGISTKFHAKGPENTEDAEGIIRVISALRQARPDVFINATVGTWASPFWFHYADSIWRQENDFGQAGDAGDKRDRWITYRDRLVYEVFVQGAPLFPINSLMTHGTIITKNGPPRVMSRDPQNCLKEIRSAFGSGSALQEVYADHDLMNQQNGLLWDELAANIQWIRRNRDVLADVHWVGGNPWKDNDGAIYGWAAWNKKKSTLTLRNSSASEKTLHTTLREVLDVPPNLKGTVTFRNSFADQRALPGLSNRAVDIDTSIDISLHPLEVIVMEGNNQM